MVSISVFFQRGELIWDAKWSTTLEDIQKALFSKLIKDGQIVIYNELKVEIQHIY